MAQYLSRKFLSPTFNDWTKLRSTVDPEDRYMGHPNIGAFPVISVCMFYASSVTLAI